MLILWSLGQHQDKKWRESNNRILRIKYQTDSKKEGTDLTWYNINIKIHDIMCNANEIIKHYFGNLNRI